jgi:glycerol uptake facilitator-like aquaporin
MRFTWFHAALLVLCLIPFAYVAGFAYPAGDDFQRAIKARYLFDLYEGLHEMLRAWWTGSGRFTHHFLIVFLGDLAESRAGYAAACLGGILLFGTGLAGLFSTLAREDTVSNGIVPALIGLFAVYGGFQALPATAYILTDLLGIWLGSGLVIWFLWGLCRLWLADRPSRSHVWFPACSGVLAIGCYEHSALAVLLAMAAALGLARHCRHPQYPAFKNLAVVIGIAFLLMVCARGNFRRQTKRGADLALISTQLLRAWPDYLAAAGWFFRSVFPFAALVLALAVTPKQRADIRQPSARFLVAGSICLFIALGVGLTLIHAMSDVTITRTGKLPANLALLYGILLCALLTGICASLRRLCARLIPAWIVVLAAIAGIVWGAPNTLNTLASLTSGKAAAVSRQAALRVAVARSASGDLTVAPFCATPYPLYGDPLNADAEIWPNSHIAKLYGLDRIQSALFPADPAFLPTWPTSPACDIPGLGKAAFFSPPKTNATYATRWLMFFPKTALASAQLLIVPDPGPGRLMPQWLQRAFLGLPGSLADQLPPAHRPDNLPAQAATPRNAQTRFMAYTHTLIPHGPDMLVTPIGPVDVKPLALFLSADGEHFTRIALDDVWYANFRPRPATN